MGSGIGELAAAMVGRGAGGGPRPAHLTVPRCGPVVVGGVVWCPVRELGRHGGQVLHPLTFLMSCAEGHSPPNAMSEMSMATKLNREPRDGRGTTLGQAVGYSSPSSAGRFRLGRPSASRMSVATQAGLSREEKWPHRSIEAVRAVEMARQLLSRSSWFDQSLSP